MTSLLHRSPGLTTIYNEIKSSQRNRVLDLGPAMAGTFEFLSDLSCKIHFENLSNLLPADEALAKKISSKKLQEMLSEYLSTYLKDNQFDIIFTWDYFNYFDQQTLQVLMTCLIKHCRPDTLIHSIRYMNSSIPEQPRGFEIADQYYVKITQQGELQPKRHRQLRLRHQFRGLTPPHQIYTEGRARPSWQSAPLFPLPHSCQLR